jgi:hypothetical protein
MAFRDPDTGRFISAEEYFSEFEDFDYEDFGSEMDGDFDFEEGEY